MYSEDWNTVVGVDAYLPCNRAKVPEGEFPRSINGIIGQRIMRFLGALAGLNVSPGICKPCSRRMRLVCNYTYLN